MNADELMKKVAQFGTDEEGIHDRFGDNAELYAICFNEFLSEPNFDALKKAVDAKDCDAAFQAAHALKGLSGNLGATAIYMALSVLVESLRAKSPDNIESEYALVMREHGRLVQLCGDGDETACGAPPDEVKLAPAEKPAAQDGTKKPGHNQKAFLLRTICVTLAILLLVGFLFLSVGRSFRSNITDESGRHLTEIANQIRLYIEEQIDRDWTTAQNIADNLESDNFNLKNDEAIYDMLVRKHRLWDVSDIIIYTVDGYCVNAQGETEMNDFGSNAIDQARSLGRYMTVSDSRIVYTVPVSTDVTYNGSTIAAIATVQDMGTYLDEMSFSSFGRQAWIYLTEESGVVISMLSSPDAVRAYNFKAIARGMNVDPLDAQVSESELYTADEPAAFLLHNADQSLYAVSAPVYTGAAPFRVYYLAPEAVINRAMNEFSGSLTVFSCLIMVLFAVSLVFAFYFMYKNRKQRFDRELMTRERMFDLLVKNTRTAFGLFSLTQDLPVYISSNSESVVGSSYWVFERADGRIRVRADADSDVIRQANEMLSGWDGKSSFKSDHIRNEYMGKPYYFEFELYPVDDDTADYVGIAQDVTAVHDREEAVRAAMEIAKKASSAKSQFLSNMSHDIRTPLNAIMNMSAFALESIDHPKQLGPYLHTIYDSADHLLHIINDVLDMSRIESGKTVLVSDVFVLSEAVSRQVEIIHPLCQAKHLTLITQLSALEGVRVTGDSLKFSQIIMNLLSNAVKFTPENGAVRISAYRLPSLREDTVDIRFTVEDNGIGIKQADLAHIFDPFARADDKRISEIEGTGLGLSICKSYISAMGGTIRVDSEEGSGTTFTVELFFRSAADEPENAHLVRHSLKAPYLGMHCLVAEDNATNRIIAKELLERLGFIVDFAVNGAECLHLFEISAPEVYDVIYMDIKMPVLDGYQAAAAIRKCAHVHAKTVPIIAMTANLFADDVEKARIVGMDAYVGKPIISHELIEQTDKALAKMKGSQE